MSKGALNRSYKLVWSYVKQALVVAGENAKSHGKKGGKRLVNSAAALTLGVSSAAFAIPNEEGEPTVVDGGGESGELVLEGTTTIGSDDVDTIYTNFFTEGGAGSGGGAGLGGVFFVNEGATLVLNNVSFKSNAVKGGEGGSLPAVDIDTINIALRDQEASVGSVTAFQITPVFDVVGGNYVVTGYEMTDPNDLIIAGGLVSVNGADGSTTVGNVMGTSVSLSNALDVSAGAITGFNPGTTSVNGTSVTVVPPADPAFADPYGNLGGGEFLVGANGEVGAKIVSVTRNSDGFVTGFELDQAPTVAVSNIITIRSAETAQFAVDPADSNTLIFDNASALGLREGMQLEGDTIPAGTTIQSIDGNRVTLSSAITDVSFTAVAPALYTVPDGQGGTRSVVKPSNPDGRLAAGMTVSLAGGTYTVHEVLGNGDIVLNTDIGDVAIPDEGIRLSASQVTAQNGNTVTVLNAEGLQAGMEVSGEGLPEGATITSVNGNQVTFSSTEGEVVGFSAADSLRKGGSMNGIAETGSQGADGDDGIDARVGSAFLNEGEGLPGTNGLGADDGEGAAGGDGGNGGDGSDGMPFNYQLVKEIIDTTFAAGFETAEATSNFATFPPAGAEAAVHFAAAILEYINLAEAIANLVLWNIDLVNGTVGLGGAGGDGGEGGGGDTFYGGGAGGDGGNAGDGALAATTGEDGGNGAKGGAGGFGAGGGSGGAGGDAGQGRAADGDPGDGGDAGFGAGEGSRGDGLYGGGGSGFGGALFVRDGGFLEMRGNALLENNNVYAGSSNNRGEAGESAGSDLFIMRGGDVLLAPGAGNTITIRGTIADDSQGTYDSASWAAGNGAYLRIGGGGLVQLEGENTYTGATRIQGATLEAEDGVGINSDSRIIFEGAGQIGDGLNAHNNAGVLLAEGEVVRRVGILPTSVTWDGAGGYAASTEEGLTLNFGKITDSLGQLLTWNSNSIADDSVIIFGGEYGMGAVTLINNIDLNGSTGNVAVFDSALTDLDHATMSGTLFNGSLNVGDTDYNGTLYLTGQSVLTNLTVNNGTTTTEGGGHISNLDAEVGTNVTVTGGSLILKGDENLGLVDVQDTASLTTDGVISADATTVDGTITSNGAATYASLTVTDGGVFNANAALTVTTTVNNQLGGTVNQAADITANATINNGGWAVVAVDGDDTHALNTATLVGDGTFSLDTEAGTGNLDINQSGNSTFAGVIEGAGSVAKQGEGNLTVSGSHTFTGGLDVEAGTFTTAAAPAPLAPAGAAAEVLPGTGGLLADTLAVTVFDGASFVAFNADTVGSFTLNEGGNLEMYADLTTGQGVTLNGTWTSHSANTLTMGTGLTGSATGTLDVGADNLVLSQAGDTTYTGSITGASDFVKTGVGTLTLDGAEDAVDVTGDIVINAGGLAADSAEVLADTSTIVVEGAGTLDVNAAQTIASLANSADVIIDATLTALIAENTADGTINQNADATISDAVNNGQWNVNAVGEVTTHALNTAVLTGAGTFTLTTTEAGTGNLDINQSGNSTFAGVIEGAGSVKKQGAGNLTVSGANTFTGGLDVEAGTFTTAAGSGTLADTLDVTVRADAIFDARNEDTVGSYTIDADGTLNMYADLTTGQGVTLNGTLNSTGADSLVMGTGLSGSTGSLEISESGFSLTQSGDTAYGGSISGLGGFTKLGEGTLTLNGAADSVYVEGGITIDGGRLALDGAYILNANQDVLVTDMGSLELVSGDQKINELSGSGLIELGSNTLEIDLGGSFFGTVTGSGTIDVLGGDFSTANDITSTDGTFNTSTGATTTVNNNTTLSFPTVEVDDGGLMEVQGTVSASTGVTVASGAVMHLGNAVAGTAGTVETTQTTVAGTLSGNGSVSGATVVVDGGQLSPGNSPGILSFADLTLESGSNSALEIEGAGLPGIDFDQIVVSGSLNIESGAILDIQNSNLFELAMGQSVNIFNVADGSISGEFGSVTSEFNNDVVFNVATGNVIGMGATGTAGFIAAAGQTMNQAAMLDTLAVNSTGGVTQFRGGYLAERLAAAHGNSAAQAEIFAQASPEVYVALLDQARHSLFASKNALPDNVAEAKDTLSVRYGYERNETDSGLEYAQYRLRRDGIGVQYDKAFEWGVVSVGVMSEQRDIESRYFSGDADGNSYGLSSAFSLNDAWSINAQVNWIDQETSVRRTTGDGFALANDIDADGYVAGLGLAYFKAYGDTNVSSSIAVLGYEIDVDALDESNDSVLDSLQVRSQDADGTAITADLKVLTKVSERVRLGGHMSFVDFGENSRYDVTANVTTETTPFTVMTPATGDSVFGLGLNAQYEASDDWVFSFDLGMTGEDSIDDTRAEVRFDYRW